MPRRTRRWRRHQQQAAASDEQNPSSRTPNYNLQFSVVARSTGTVPPNNISLTAGNINGGRTVTSVASTSSPTPGNISNTQAMDRFSLQHPEISVFHSTSRGQRIIDIDDDVIYLYSVDSRPDESLVEQVDLTQSQDNSGTGSEVRELGDTSVMTGEVENTLSTSPKPPRNLKRKLEEDKATEKKKKIEDRQPKCSRCNIHNDSLIKTAESMFVGSCGHLLCGPCTRIILSRVKYCEICKKKIYTFRKLFF